MSAVYLYDGLRTPFGRYAGVLSSVRPDDLVAGLAKALVARAGIASHEIEDMILGCANQAGEDARNVARHAVLAAGLSHGIGGQTVNRLCGSGLAAVIDASRAIRANEGAIFLAGGVESMSRAPFVFAKSEQPFNRDLRLFDSTIGSRFPNPAIVARYGDPTMPQTAENIAHDYAITRTRADQFAESSQQKFQRAMLDEFFVDEINPVPVISQTTQTNATADEHPRPNSNFATLSLLKPLHDGGVVTPGNASGINDGAALLLLGNEAAGQRINHAPIARILGAAIAGVEPRLMGMGPAYAIPKALARSGLSLSQMDVIEINEAFAVQVLGCLKALDISETDSRVNPNGGAIAVGHPLGASGARLVLTAARQLRRSGGRYAVISLCIGVGQGIALVIENL